MRTNSIAGRPLASPPPRLRRLKDSATASDYPKDTKGERRVSGRPKRERPLRPPRAASRPVGALLAEAVRWPFQTAFEFPENPPAMPRMVSSRRPKGDLVFQSRKMAREVRCESGVERSFFSQLDALPEVLWFHEQAPKLKYEMHGRVRDYYPDALVALRNGFVFIAEVKTVGDFALYETICKLNALAARAHADGRGVFLGNDSCAIGDVIRGDVPRVVRAAVLSACRGPSGMSANRWRDLRQWSNSRYGIRSTALQTLALKERLVITERPFNVRPGTPDEETQIDAFVERFGTRTSLLPLWSMSRAGGQEDAPRNRIHGRSGGGYRPPEEGLRP